MGIDLCLIPFELQDDRAFPCGMLDLNRHSDLWPIIRALPTRPVPEEFKTYLSTEPIEGFPDYEFRHEGNTQIDAYDDPLLCVSVVDLLSVADSPWVKGDWYNRAAWAYLRELPDRILVALYWC
jgi:hypothetical protein